MEIGIKSLLLAGIGALTMTYEKGMEMIEDLVKKGELTVSQGKELTEELKRKSTVKAVQKQDEPPLTAGHLREILSGLDLATKDELRVLRERIEALESK